ncbi:Predicted amidohydrolase [Carboxydocella sporoproducens DSM 16521]|uniref:Predicted amidohydrolase n=2 Tax=Carboxydocella TaxID=178898 RepID=A0A1T4S0W3_9FIRM|nr:MULTISPECIES: nitrilase-related carbon-nitrogen hydrolase [Carboxydocella]SKA21746.1 Predicted amidohydrolase [Carboxydocella sporoproducens DSM 16521]
MKIAAVQWLMQPLTWAEFEKKYSQTIAFAAQSGARLVVFPEYVTGGLLARHNLKQERDMPFHWAEYSQPFRQLVQTLAEAYQIAIISGSQIERQGQAFYNVCHLAVPGKGLLTQAKLHLTPWEQEYWQLTAGEELVLASLPDATVGVMICYDSEFPTVAAALAEAGADLLCCPYCTEDEAGFWRVRYCLQARAVELQLGVVASPTIGFLPEVPGLEQHHGRAALLTPCDLGFPPRGIQAEGQPGLEQILIAELPLAQIRASRQQGSVRPWDVRRQDLMQLPVRKL